MARPRPYGPEVREAARVWVEETRVGMERIGLELGIARWTLHRWQRRFGWQRPTPRERAAWTAWPGRRGPDFYRARRLGRPYGGDAVGTARDLVTGSTLPLDRVAERAGVSRATLYRWILRHGWARPPALAPGTTGACGATGAGGASGATGRRYRPAYGFDVVAAARELYCTTRLPTAIVAARARTTTERVRHWARSGGWIRPRDDLDPDGRVRRRRARRGFGLGA